MTTILVDHPDILMQQWKKSHLACTASDMLWFEVFSSLVYSHLQQRSNHKNDCIALAQPPLGISWVDILVSQSQLCSAKGKARNRMGSLSIPSVNCIRDFQQRRRIKYIQPLWYRQLVSRISRASFQREAPIRNIGANPWLSHPDIPCIIGNEHDPNYPRQWRFFPLKAVSHNEATLPHGTCGTCQQSSYVDTLSAATG